MTKEAFTIEPDFQGLERGLKCTHPGRLNAFDNKFIAPLWGVNIQPPSDKDLVSRIWAVLKPLSCGTPNHTIDT